MKPTSDRFKQINTHTHTHTIREFLGLLKNKQLSYMGDEYRRIYEKGNLDYTSPLNFMLTVHKNSVSTANKTHFVSTATTSWFSLCISMIVLHSEDRTKHVNKISGRYTLILIRLFHSVTFVHTAKQQNYILYSILLIPSVTSCSSPTNWLLLTWYCRVRVSSCNIYAVQQDTQSGFFSS